MSANHSLQNCSMSWVACRALVPSRPQRIAYYLLEADAEEARRLAEAILEVKQEVHFCSRCFNYATADECSICQDSMRDTTSHLRGGRAARRPGNRAHGQLPRSLPRIGRRDQSHGQDWPRAAAPCELLARLGHEDIHEVIIATNPNIEGRDHGELPGPPYQAAGRRVSRSGERPARGRRPGVCRRAYAWPRHRARRAI